MREWVPTIAYAFVAWVAWGARGRLLLKRADQAAHAFFWKLMSVLLALLCISSLVNLQGFLHLAGKELAISEGWYQQRRVIQVIILLWLGVSSLGVAGYLTWLQRKMSWGHHLALIGVFYLLGLQAVRAVSLHQVDKILAFHWRGYSVNSLLESAGIISMLLVAYLSGRKGLLQKRRPKRRHGKKIARSRIVVEKTDPLEQARQRLARRVAYREKQAGLQAEPDDTTHHEE